MTKDMTQGSPLKLILGFAIPVILGNLFQNAYNMVDSAIVGRFLGVDALAAVGSAGGVIFLIIGFCMGTTAGFTIPISQAFGAKDIKLLKRYMGNSVLTAAAISVAMSVITCILCGNILTWMNTPANVYDEAYAYLFIIFAGIPATVLYNMVSSVMRSVGDSKTPLYFLIMSSGLNILLDLFCIIVLKQGAAGAAMATVISQLVAGIASLIYFVHKFHEILPEREDWKPVPSCIKRLCAIGMPMGLQYSVTAIGSVILQSSVNSLGSLVMAAVTAANRINGLFACPTDGLGATLATYSGQNLGAGKPDRIRKGLRVSIIIGCVYVTIAWIVLYLVSNRIIMCFIEPGQTEVIAHARQLLLFNASFFYCLVFINTTRFLIQGIGYSSLAIVSGLMEMVARAAAGLFIIPALGYLGVCLASPLAWVLADIFLFFAYHYVMRKTEERLKNETLTI